MSSNEPSTFEKHHSGLRRAIAGLFAGYLFGIAVAVIGLATSGHPALYPSSLTDPLDFIFAIIGAGVGYYNET